jgi:hypothetical protein
MFQAAVALAGSIPIQRLYKFSRKLDTAKSRRMASVCDRFCEDVLVIITLAFVDIKPGGNADNLVEGFRICEKPTFDVGVWRYLDRAVGKKGLQNALNAILGIVKLEQLPSMAATSRSGIRPTRHVFSARW